MLPILPEQPIAVPSMITLLSDFGYQDAYVAMMKGAIATIAGAAVTCDLTHGIAPQDILAARFNLMMAYSHFPVGTVHLAVVDPGVGSGRREIAIKCPCGFFVGPDNGILSGVLQQEPVLAAVALTNPDYWRVPNPSNTFHGRDIFAPAAAHLATGVAITELGTSIDPKTLTQADLPFYTPVSAPSDLPSTADKSSYSGCIQYIDRFGNLISNLPGHLISDHLLHSRQAPAWQVSLEMPALEQNSSRALLGIDAYYQVPVGALAALVGSHGWVEIACSGGSAAEVLAITGLTTAKNIRVQLCIAVA